MPEQEEEKKIPNYDVIVVDTVNSIQNDQYMGLLDRKTMVTRDKWKDFGSDLYCFMTDFKTMGFTCVLVLGYEGSGKSYGIKSLNPNTTKWFHADNKPITFKGGKQNYTIEKGNLAIPTTYSEIIDWCTKGIRVGAIDIKKEPIVFLLAHIDDFKSGENTGEIRQRMKILGNLGTKMNLEGSVSYCFYTEVRMEGTKPVFKLRTQNTGKNTGRTPEQMFETELIDNNFQQIVDAIRAY